MSSTSEGRRPGVCYLAPDVPVPFPSGAAVHVSEVARSLQRMGHEVHVVCRRSSGGQPRDEDLGGVSLHRVNRLIVGTRRGRAETGRTGTLKGGAASRAYGLYLRTVFAFYAALVAKRTVEEHGLGAIVERETAFGAGAMASLLTGKPLVLEVVGPRYSRLSVSRSSKILYYTETMLRPWVDRRKCVKVAAGANLDMFRPDPEARARTRARLGLDGRFVVGYVGSFQPWHGVDALMRAVAVLKGRGADVAALMVGPAPGAYRATAQALGISEACRFTGPVAYEEVPPLVNAFDAAAAPYDVSTDRERSSRGIGFPIKVLEYMACAKPVVASNMPPLDELFATSGSAALVQPGDVDGLADALHRLAGDPGLARRMGDAGAEVARRSYSWDSFARCLSAAVTSAGAAGH